MPLPQLPPDLGRSLDFSEAQTFKRNTEAAKRAFLRVAGEIMNPETPDEYGLRLGGGPSSMEVQLAVVTTAVKLRTREASTPLFELFVRTSTPPKIRRAIVEALAELRAGQADEALRVALRDPGLQSAALPYLDRLAAGSESATLLSNLVQQATLSDSLKTAQIALTVLGTLGHESALPVLGHAIERWKTGQLAPELELDLRDAVARTSLSNALPPRAAEPESAAPLNAFRASLVGEMRREAGRCSGNTPLCSVSAVIRSLAMVAPWAPNSTVSEAGKAASTCWKASSGPIRKSRRSSRPSH